MQRKNILVVDDEDINHFICRKILTPIDWIDNISYRKNGKEALQLIMNCCEGQYPLPDIILLDLDMPLMGGMEFIMAFNELECLNRKQSDIMLAVLSSSNDPEDHRVLAELGIPFVSKPLSEEKFRNLLVQNNS